MYIYLSIHSSQLCFLWASKHFFEASPFQQNDTLAGVDQQVSAGKGSRTTPHEDNSPPDKNKAQPLPTRTTIPRTIPHQDNSPLGPLPWNKTTHQDQNLYGGELSSWGVVRIRLEKDYIVASCIMKCTLLAMCDVLFME